MQSYRYSCQNLMKPEFSRQFRKVLQRQISWKSAQWEPICSIRTDRHDEDNSQFVKTPKNMFGTKPETQLPFYAVHWAVGSSAALNTTMRTTAFGLKHTTCTVHTGTLIDEDALRRGTAVAQWLRCFATNRRFAGSIPDDVNGLFIDIKPFRSPYGPGVDSASNRNEYQEYFPGVKAAGAYGW
jgi:hypothetical protein